MLLLQYNILNEVKKYYNDNDFVTLTYNFTNICLNSQYIMFKI